MAKGKANQPGRQRERKPVAWLHGEIKAPPFTPEGRKEAGDFLRLLQEGVKLGMPQAERLPIVGPRCGALRIRDGHQNWRVTFRLDPDAVLVLEVYARKTREIPKRVIDQCKTRLKHYDDTAKKAAKQAAKVAEEEPPKKTMG